MVIFYSPIKIIELYISYFYNIIHFMRDTIKFSSLKLDIYNSTYDFSKLVQKSIKEKTETLNRSR